MEGDNEFESVFNALDEFEKSAKIESKMAYQWFEEVGAPETKLLDKMTEKLFDPEGSSAMTLKLLHCLYLFLRISNESVREQLSVKSERLCSILSFYLTNAENLEMAHDCVTIIASIYQSKYFNGFLNEQFIKCLFDELGRIDDEYILQSSVGILIEINGGYTGIEDNAFLNVYHDNENNRLFNEVVLRIFNNETEKDKMNKILLCLNNIMDKEEKNIFYSNDLDSYIDMLIMKLESTYNDDLKLFLFESLQRITSFDDYYKTMYKINLLTDLMDDYIGKEDESPTIKALCKKIMACVVKKIESKLKMDNKGNDEDDDEEGEGEDEEGEDEEGEEEDTGQ